jgi:surface protein
MKLLGNGGNFNWLNTSNITNMSRLFTNIYLLDHFNGDISKWDVSNVTDMTYMFRESRFDGDISNWDVSNVKNMNKMF